MKKVSSGLWGLVLVLLGVALGVNALGIVDINFFFPGWWTLFIIVPCLIGLIGNDDKGADAIGLVIGVCLLLACQNMISFRMLWKLLPPAILVMIGLSIMFKDLWAGKVKKEMKKLQGKSGEKEYWATFSGQKLNFAGQKFTGCRLEAVFGGIKCDLRDAILEEDVFVKASGIFGGVTIYAPKDVNVQVISTSLFGGVSNEYSNRALDETKKTLYIDTTNIFGGVEIK